MLVYTNRSSFAFERVLHPARRRPNVLSDLKTRITYFRVTFWWGAAVSFPYKNFTMLKQIFLPLLLLFTISLSAQEVFPTPQLITVDQQPAELADYVGQGTPTVIAIWATWCQPCHMELDHMKPYLAKWEEQYGAKVLAISVDKRHMINRIKPLVSRKGWKYDVLVDTDGKLQTELGFRSIPQMYVLDGEGNIVESFKGYQQGRETQVERLIKKLAK